MVSRISRLLAEIRKKASVLRNRRAVLRMRAAIAADLESIGLSADGFSAAKSAFPQCTKLFDKDGYELVFLRCGEKSSRHETVSFLPRAKNYVMLYSAGGELMKVWRFD